MGLDIEIDPISSESRVRCSRTKEDVTGTVSISEIELSAKAGYRTRARLTVEVLSVKATVTGDRTEWLTKHPLLEKLAPLKALEFADGTRVELGADGVPHVVQPQ